MLLPEFLDILKYKKWEQVNSHYKKFIKIKNKSYHIGFNVTFVNPYICLTNVEICTCVIYCCGRKKDNTIITSKKDFESYIDKLIKEYEK